MSRKGRTPRALRRFVAGSLRASGEGARLPSLLLAPAPEWVALDLESGAVVRGANAPSEVYAPLSAGPLEPVLLELANEGDPWDPSRPEAVELSAVYEADTPSRRAMRRLLDDVVNWDSEGGLPGGSSPVVPYSELSGSRHSVAVVAPDRVVMRSARERLATGASYSYPATAQFRLGDRHHSLPVVPSALDWVEGGLLSESPARAHGRRGRGRRRPPGRGGQVGTARLGQLPAGVLLVIGLQAPQSGQVRKAVLGLVRAP